MENVPGVCGDRNIKTWNEWLDRLEKLGYSSYWAKVNAKDHGIPQNRLRVFMVSILGEYGYHFPKKRKLRKLTPLECMRLMGFSDGDVDAMRAVGMSDSAIYHCAGDSIVVDVLMDIFKELL